MRVRPYFMEGPMKIEIGQGRCLLCGKTKRILVQQRIMGKIAGFCLRCLANAFLSDHRGKVDKEENSP